MKSKSILTFLCLSVFYVSFAQQKAIDSLEQQLITPNNGKSRLINLIHLGWYYQYFNPKKGILRLDEAIELAIEKKDSARLAEAYAYKGGCNFVLGQDSTAFVLYNKTRDIYSALDSTSVLARHLFNTASLYSQRDNYEKALELFQNAFEQFVTKKDTLHMGYSILQIGKENMRLGNYTNAMKSILKGKLLLESINQDKSEYYGDLLATLGSLYQRLDKLDSSLKLYKNSLEIYKAHNIDYQIAGQYFNIASIYNDQKKYKKAITNYLVAKNIHKKTNNLASIASTQSNIGESYQNSGNYKLATSYIDSAIVTNKKLENNELLAQNYNIKGVISFNTENYKKAKKMYDLALKYANKVGAKKTIRDIKIGIAKTASQLGNFKNAYKVLSEVKILNDSLLNDTKKEELAVLQAEYEFDKEKEVLEANFQKDQALQQAAIERQVLIRNQSVGAGIFLLLLSFGGFLLWRKKREADYNTQISESKLLSLQAQMNPHFIFNTLNSINDYILKNEKKTAGTYLAEFSNMIRKTLENTVKEDISLEEEIQFLENYISLEQKRLQQKFTFTITVDSSIDVESTFLPPSLVQPFVENSIWHGLSEKEEGQLSVHFTKTAHNLICTIEDNGKGLSKEQASNSSHTSFGLENIRNRLNVLNKAKNTLVTFDIKNKQEQEGVIATIALPLTLKF